MTLAEYAANLRRKIKRQSDAYYNHSDDTMPDADFDRLVDTLRLIEREHPELVTKDSPTTSVGAPVFDLRKVNHIKPVLSLDKAADRNDLRAFLRRFPNQLFSIEEKIDGLTAVVTYENGKLARIATRGNGLTGVDVTRNYTLIGNLPNTISYKDTLVIRGEVYVTFNNFDRINRNRAKRNLLPFLTPRGAASSFLMMRDFVSNGGFFNCLAFRAFDPITVCPNVETAVQFHNFCSINGISTVAAVCFRQPDRLDDAIAKLDRRREHADRATDGIVIKILDFNERRLIGETKRAPKWAIALKEKSFSTRKEKHVMTKSADIKSLVHISDDRVVLTSLDLAATFDKEHAKVIRSIELEIDRLKVAADQADANFGVSDSEPPFIKSSYVDSTGKSNKMYEMTQKGFMAIAMGFTGDKASRLRWLILDEFEAKERELRRLRADRLFMMVSEEYHASLPVYKKSMNAVKSLIEYALTQGARRDDIDPYYYKAVNGAINHAIGIKNERRPFLSPTATVHIRNINRNVARIIRSNIENGIHFSLIFGTALDTVVNYAADNIDDTERKRFGAFADANKERVESERAKERFSEPARIEEPTAVFDKDYDFEEYEPDDPDDFSVA